MWHNAIEVQIKMLKQAGDGAHDPSGHFELISRANSLKVAFELCKYLYLVTDLH